MKKVKQYSEEQLLKRMVTDRRLRTAVTRDSHWWFFQFYFAGVKTHASAHFQEEMFALSEQDSIQNLVVVAFRSSGKSTILTTSYPIWAVLGRPQKKFVVIIGQTRSQARQHLYNIKVQFETNKLLRNDLGPFYEETDEWGAYALVLPKIGARIQVFSTEQNVRGYRHGQYRPDLIICDDVEDIQSVKTKEGRDKLHEWIKSEVLPAGDLHTRFIYVGNYLHDDSFLMRQKRSIEEGKLKGVFKSYPLIDQEGKIIWPGKYPNMATVEKHRQMIDDEAAWQREFLLRIIPTTEQVIHKEWIQYYETVPEALRNKFRFGALAVDPALSGKETADYTAMVSVEVYGYGDELRIFVLPNPINQRLDTPAILKGIEDVANSFPNGVPYVFVENVAFQQAIVDILEKQGMNIEGVNPKGQDKHTRLALISNWIKSGRVLFPRRGAEDLIQQLVGFPSERHDDLTDALVIAINKVGDKARAGENSGIMVPLARPLRHSVSVDDLERESYGREANWDLLEDAEMLGRINRGDWTRLM